MRIGEPNEIAGIALYLGNIAGGVPVRLLTTLAIFSLALSGYSFATTGQMVCYGGINRD